MDFKIPVQSRNAPLMTHLWTKRLALSGNQRVKFFKKILPVVYYELNLINAKKGETRNNGRLRHPKCGNTLLHSTPLEVGRKLEFELKWKNITWNNRPAEYFTKSKESEWKFLDGHEVWDISVQTIFCNQIYISPTLNLMNFFWKISSPDHSRGKNARNTAQIFLFLLKMKMNSSWKK